MKKENKQKARERRAAERAKQEGRAKAASMLRFWGPIALVVVVVVVLVIAIATSGEPKSDAAAGDDFEDVMLVDEDGNPMDSLLFEDDRDLDTTEGRVVEVGDTVNIDYKGYIDGVAFEGGEAEGDTLTIGSGEFIPGFEDSIVGHKVGETIEVRATFPEDFGDDELDGKEAVFTTTINGVYE